MVNKDNFEAKALELLEEVKPEVDGFIFTDKAKAMVKELAEYARKTELFHHNEKLREEFLNNNEITPNVIYVYMLNKIITAPTGIHMVGTITLLLPILDDALNKESGEATDGQ